MSMRTTISEVGTGIGLGGRGRGGSADGSRAARAELPGLHRLRGVLLAFGLLAIAGAGSGAPAWTWLVPAVTAVAIPGAVALQYGRSAIRTLLALVPRPPVRGASVPSTPPTRPK
jgi:hypothetical protein